MTIKTAPSCADDYDPESLSVDAALHTIKASATPIKDYEQVALKDALHRVLAENLKSSINVPGHDNSAMDGYAIRFADLKTDGNTSFTGHRYRVCRTPFKEIAWAMRSDTHYDRCGNTRRRRCRGYARAYTQRCRYDSD